MVEFFLLALLVSLVVLIFLFGRLWALRHTPGAFELLWCVVTCGLWSFGYFMEIVMPGLEAKVFWARFQYLGIAFVGLCVLQFLLRYTGRIIRFPRPLVVLHLVIPILTLIFTYTNEAHGWMWAGIQMPPGRTLGPLLLEHGPWFWVIIGYSYLLLLAGTLLSSNYVFRIQTHYRAQPLIMLAGILAPWVGNALYILGIRPGNNIDLTPIAFTVTNVGLFLGFIRFRLLDLLPVAYSSIFQCMSDGVIVLDTHQRVVDINPAAGKIFSPFRLSPPTQPKQRDAMEQHSLIGRRISALLPDWNSLASADAAMEGQEIALNLGSETETRVYTLRVSPITNRRQQTTGQVLIFTDITWLKQAEARMRLQATALEAAENGILITNPEGIVEWANPAMTRLTGYALEEIVGQTPRMLKSGKHPAVYYKTLWDTIQSGAVWHGELVNRRKDGSLYHEEMTITPLVRPDGSIPHFIAIKQDISERKRAEEQMRIAHEQAVESNRMKTQLLANVSHDMRTPLGAIIGYSDMLNAGVLGALEPDQKSAVSDIQDSANQLLLFVNNLIGQAQFETGRILMRPKPFEVEELVEACRMAVRLPAQRKGLRVLYEIDPALPECMTGDLYWLRQIALNLMNNAIKFTDQGSITLRIYRPDPEHWSMEVADTGVGIARETQALLFEPFRQGSGAPSRERGGSGLGLAIVKELATLMGGSVRLVSQPGAGSTFTVYLPWIAEEKKP